MVINCRRAIHRFDSANSVTTCAVFLANPRKRTFASPNWGSRTFRVIRCASARKAVAQQALGVHVTLPRATPRNPLDFVERLDVRRVNLREKYDYPGHDFAAHRSSTMAQSSPRHGRFQRALASAYLVTEQASDLMPLR
jgi:hypothetical protein